MTGIHPGLTSVFPTIAYPIFQAPTGSIAGTALASAVAACGAVGALGLTWTEPDAASVAVRSIRARSPGPFLVNFALAFEPRSLGAALDAGAPAVSFSWGDPGPYVAQVRSYGARFGMQACSREAILHARNLGADFIVCQGLEAGGHVESRLPLSELLECARDLAGPVPVIAAGGLATGSDLRTVLERGAAAGMFGTRFVASHESLAHATYKERLVAASADETVLTGCFDGGWANAPHRVLRNETYDAWDSAGRPAEGARPGEGDIVAASGRGQPIVRYEDTAPREGMTGDVTEMALYAGTGVERITSIAPAAEIVQNIWVEACRETGAR